MSKVAAFGRLEGVAHRLDRGVTDGMSGNLQTGTRSADHELAHLRRGRTPRSPAGANRDAFGSAVDEYLDRPGPHESAPEPRPNSNSRGRVQQLPGKELVDADSQPTVLRELLVCPQVVSKSPVDRGADRSDAA